MHGSGTCANLTTKIFQSERLLRFLGSTNQWQERQGGEKGASLQIFASASSSVGTQTFFHKSWVLDTLGLAVALESGTITVTWMDQLLLWEWCEWTDSQCRLIQHQGLSCAPPVVGMWLCVMCSGQTEQCVGTDCAPQELEWHCNHNFCLCVFHSEFRTAKGTQEHPWQSFHTHVPNSAQALQMNPPVVGSKMVNLFS